jgi:hypothetical protein
VTVALTIHQPYPSLIAHGVKEWETRPHPPAGWSGIPEGTRRMPGCRVEPGETVLIHAAAKRPVHLSRVGEWFVHSRFTEPESGPEIRRLGSVHNGELVPDRYERGLAIPMPLGAVVATARILDVVPIAECDWHSNHICLPWSGELTHHSPMDEPHDNQTEHDISDQLPYGEWTPGRWAWRLGDVRKLDEPVREYLKPCGIGNQCWGEDCCPSPLHGGVVPVRGRQGVWRPAPALVAACGVTP